MKKDIKLEVRIREGDNTLSVNGNTIDLDESLFDAVPYKANELDVVDLKYRATQEDYPDEGKEEVPEVTEGPVYSEAGDITELFEEMGLDQEIHAGPCPPEDEREYANITIYGNFDAEVYKTGKAYAFFDCDATKDEIEGELPLIRETVQTPKQLELSLTEDPGQLRLDEELSAIAKEAKEAEIKYVMEAVYPDATNKQAADELATILNQAYQSPLYEEGEQFRGQVVYEDNGRYLFRE